jgi:hypothetical protein
VNLHSVITSVIGAVNPNQLVGIRSSTGNTVTADGTPIPAYATPGAITGSIGGSMTASASGANLTVTAIQGSLWPGDAVSGSDGTNSLLAGTTILSQTTGQPGSTGVYVLSAPTASGTLNSCTVTSASTVLNVTAITAGVIQAGQTLLDNTNALFVGTLVTGQLPALNGQLPNGGIGLYSVSDQQTVLPQAMTTAMAIMAQVQPLAASELRHMDMLNLQGTHRAIYINGLLRGAVRVGMKGGDLVTLADGSDWLVTQPLESFFSTAGWTKCAITLQNEARSAPPPPTGPAADLTKPAGAELVPGLGGGFP